MAGWPITHKICAHDKQERRDVLLGISSSRQARALTCTHMLPQAASCHAKVTGYGMAPKKTACLHCCRHGGHNAGDVCLMLLYSRLPLV